MRFGWVVVLVLVISVSCAKKPTRRIIPMPAETATVLVTKDGKIFYNERAVTADQLKTELIGLKGKHGAVWLIDESPLGQYGEPVKKAIIAAELPIRVR